MNVGFLRFLDKILVFFLFVLYPLKNFFIKKKHTKKKVLIVRLWAMGDAILLMPFIEKLNKEGYKVDVLTTEIISSLFSTQEFIGKTHIFNYKNPFAILKLIKTLRREKYEYVIDSEQFMNTSVFLDVFSGSKKIIGFSHLFRSKFFSNKVNYVEREHMLVNFSKLFRPLNINFIPNKLTPLKYSEKSKKKIDMIYKKNKKLIGINMGTGGSALGRRWNPNKFVKLSLDLSRKYPNYKLVFLGLSEEERIYESKSEVLKVIDNQINLINKISKEEFFYLCTKLDLIICNDTGVMHVASAMGTRVIALFGLNDPKKVGAWPLNKNINIYKNPDNKPIINNKYSKYPSDNCSTIDLIEVSDVLNKVKKVLK